MTHGNNACDPAGSWRPMAGAASQAIASPATEAGEPLVSRCPCDRTLRDRLPQAEPGRPLPHSLTCGKPTRSSTRAIPVAAVFGFRIIMRSRSFPVGTHARAGMRVRTASRGRRNNQEGSVLLATFRLFRLSFRRNSFRPEGLRRRQRAGGDRRIVEYVDDSAGGPAFAPMRCLARNRDTNGPARRHSRLGDAFGLSDRKVHREKAGTPSGDSVVR